VHSVTVHPRFDRNRFILLLYTALSESAGVMRLLRLREVSNELGEPAVLLEGVPSSGSRPTGVLAFGPDGKIYVGSNDAELESSAGDPGELSGKLLRLNDDGTTPSDNPSESPVIALGLGQPVALGWNPRSGGIWIVDRSAALQRGGATAIRGQIGSSGGARFVSPSGDPDAVATRFGEGLFSATGGRLNWSRLVPGGSLSGGVAYELPSWFGAPQALVQGPDGLLYVASNVGPVGGSRGKDVVVRIVPAAQADTKTGG
jgi:glucose/arabinose dehydrogenase